jgi:hypothetical protein
MRPGKEILTNFKSYTMDGIRQQATPDLLIIELLMDVRQLLALMILRKMDTNYQIEKSHLEEALSRMD